MSADMTQPEEPGRGARRSPTSPSPLDDITAAFAATPREPEAGQVWRARWDQVLQTILVVVVSDDSVDAVPLSPDTELGDERTVVLDADEAPLGFDAAAWTSLRTQLPVRVLEVLLGAATSDAVARVVTREGEGAPIMSILDERAQVRDAIAERTAALAEATWVPVVPEPVDLTVAIRSRNLTPGKLAEALGIEPGLMVAIIRGDRRPSPEVAERIARLLDLERSALVQSVDPYLVRALDRPRFRRRLAHRGAEAGVTDEAAWRYRVATEMLPAAARTTGRADPYRRWLGLIEDYLR